MLTVPLASTVTSFFTSKVKALNVKIPVPFTIKLLHTLATLTVTVCPAAIVILSPAAGTTPEGERYRLQPRAQRQDRAGRTARYPDHRLGGQATLWRRVAR